VTRRLLIISAGHDVGGCGIALKRAFDHHAPDWEARAVCRATGYLDYPTDIVWQASSGKRREVIGLIRSADVVHIMDNERALRWVAPYRRGKAIVVHHLGSHFRRHERAVSQVCVKFGATQVTDSVDLVRPQVAFEPVPADFEALSRLRREHYKPSKRIRIAHAPTRRAIKSTDTILAVLDRLRQQYPIDVDLIERVGNRECLERKARADIFVDQLLLGFGMNAIECWAMGIPVVSGLVDERARAAAFDMWGELPWADATEQTLESVIEHLILDEEWRRTLGERGRAHGLEWHSEEAVVDRMLDLYDRAGAVAA
jgi:hypothetical protein